MHIRVGTLHVALLTRPVFFTCQLTTCACLLVLQAVRQFVSTLAPNNGLFGGISRRSIRAGASVILHAPFHQALLDQAWKQRPVYELIGPLNLLGDTAAASELVQEFLAHLQPVLELFRRPFGIPDFQPDLMRPSIGYQVGDVSGMTYTLCMPYDPTMLGGTGFRRVRAPKARVRHELYLGRFIPGGRLLYAHRVVCLAYHGLPPAIPLCSAGRSGRPQVVHKCGNRMCLNPDHLCWGTAQVNALHRRYDHHRYVINDQWDDDWKWLG